VGGGDGHGGGGGGPAGERVPRSARRRLPRRGWATPRTLANPPAETLRDFDFDLGAHDAQHAAGAAGGAFPTVTGNAGCVV
jgi:hypothetical protein